MLTSFFARGKHAPIPASRIRTLQRSLPELLNKERAPFAAAQGISIVFGRLSSTHEDGSGENAGRRSKIVCCIKSGGTGMQGKCGRRGLKGILYRFVFRCKTWFKTQHPYRKGRNSSACVGFRDIGTEVFFQHSVSGRAQCRAKMCKTTRWRKVDFHLLFQGLT